jgi:hypothetical protein
MWEYQVYFLHRWVANVSHYLVGYLLIWQPGLMQLEFLLYPPLLF